MLKEKKLAKKKPEASVIIPTAEELLKAGVHFGHKTSKWHPSMEPFTFTERRGVHIIDLNKTRKYLEQALTFIANKIQNNGIILLVGRKQQIQKKIAEAAEEMGMPYVNTKWVGGTLTNWSIIKRQIVKLKKMKEEKKKGEWSKYTKKERLVMQSNLNKLQETYGGIESLEKFPDLIFIFDCKEAKITVKEAYLKKVPIVALVDTNVDIRPIAYPIPANDDAVKSLTLMLNLVKEVVIKAKEASIKETK